MSIFNNTDIHIAYDINVYHTYYASAPYHFYKRAQKSYCDCSLLSWVQHKLKHQARTRVRVVSTTTTTTP